MKKILIGLLFLLMGIEAKSQFKNHFPFFTIGPMLHFNFEEGKIKPSLALEGAFWLLPEEDYKGYPLPVSIDLGFEIQKKKMRLYSELQTGIIYSGVSAGPVFEINRETNKNYWGVQGSVWANYFLA